jgi:putative ABC transport system ATP-binding protein
VSVTHDPLVAGHVDRVVAIRDGRTSTETVHRRERTEEGEHRLVAEEFAVLDRAGRLQLPRAHIEALGLRRRVRLRLEPDHVRVSADRPGEPTAMGGELGATPGDGDPPGTGGAPGTHGKDRP